MNEKQQIEEMAKVIERTGMLDSFSRCEIVAKDLYDEGYRKQSEARWFTDVARQPMVVCSNCNLSNNYNRTAYCPHCGAKMKGE